MKINEQEFIDDFNDGLTAKQLKKKYRLSNQAYRQLKEKHKLKREDWQLNFNPRNSRNRGLLAKNYVRTPSGKFAVRKCVNGTPTYFCSVETKEKARMVVQKLRACEWDKKEIYKILYEVEQELNNGS